MRGRRSLSEVLGAFIVLTVVLLSAISLVDMGSEVVKYSEEQSSQLFSRAAQEAAPPEMTMVLNGSRLYLEVFPTSPINVSYAVVNVDGNLTVLRVGKLIEGGSSIELLSDYACQNVTVYLVTSDGAIFRYSPQQDPAIRSAEGQYFNCSLLTGQGSGDGGSSPQQGVNLGPDSYPIGYNEYVAGEPQGDGQAMQLGGLSLDVKVSGWFSDGFSYYVTYNGSQGALTGTVPASSGVATAYLGSVALGGRRLYVIAYVDYARRIAGIALEVPGGYVSFSGSSNLNGTIAYQYPQATGALVAELLGFEGNFSSRWSMVQVGYWNGNYNYTYNSSSTGYGTTPGPIELGRFEEFSQYPYATYSAGHIEIAADIRLTAYAYPESEPLDIYVASPVQFSTLAYTVSQPNVSSRELALDAVLSYLSPFSIEFYTEVGDSVINSSSGAFLLPSSSERVVSYMAPQVPITSRFGFAVKSLNEGYYGSGYAWAAAAQAQPVPLIYALYLRYQGGEALVVSPPAEGYEYAYVNNVKVYGPVVPVIPGANVSMPCSGYLYTAELSNGSAGLSLVEGNLSDQDPGLYVLACNYQYFLIVYS